MKTLNFKTLPEQEVCEIKKKVNDFYFNLKMADHTVCAAEMYFSRLISVFFHQTIDVYKYFKDKYTTVNSALVAKKFFNFANEDNNYYTVRYEARQTDYKGNPYIQGITKTNAWLMLVFEDGKSIIVSYSTLKGQSLHSFLYTLLKDARPKPVSDDLKKLHNITIC